MVTVPLVRPIEAPAPAPAPAPAYLQLRVLHPTKRKKVFNGRSLPPKDHLVEEEEVKMREVKEEIMQQYYITYPNRKQKNRP